MSDRSHRLSWHPDQSPTLRASDEGVQGRPGPEELVRPLMADRASSSEKLVKEAAQSLATWALNARNGSSAAEPGAELLRALESLAAVHGWRATVARFSATVAATWNAVESHGLSPLEALTEELGLWLQGASAAPVPDASHPQPWSGEPLASGRRLPDRSGLVRPLLDDFVRGEVIAVIGYSETVITAVHEVLEAGFFPVVLLPEGSPDLAGRRVARRLAPLGVAVRLVYDAALPSALPRVDRIWFGTESIGTESFGGACVAPVGTRTLLEEARRLGVPSTLFATSDKLAPHGEITLPEWSAREDWHLWEDPPEGVRLESQAWERVPLALIDSILTENGFEPPAELALRALWTGTPTQTVES